MIRRLREWARLMLAHQEHQTMLIEEMHFFAYHGGTHPRVTSRLDRGESRTPTFQPKTGE